MTAHPFFAADPGPLLMSHSGDNSKGAKPGSLAAYQCAWDRGFRCFQIDVVALADGTLLSSHAITGRKRKWESLTLQQLRQRNSEVETVDEIVAALPDSRWNLEIKSAYCAPALTAFLRRQPLPLDRYLISSPFRTSILLALRREFGTDLALAVALVDGGLLGYRLWPRKRYGDAVQLWFPIARWSKIMAAARKAGWNVQVWSLNSRNQIERHLALGANGVITDRHDMAIEAMTDLAEPAP